MLPLRSTRMVLIQFYLFYFLVASREMDFSMPLRVAVSLAQKLLFQDPPSITADRTCLLQEGARDTCSG